MDRAEAVSWNTCNNLRTIRHIVTVFASISVIIFIFASIGESPPVKQSFLVHFKNSSKPHYATCKQQNLHIPKEFRGRTSFIYIAVPKTGSRATRTKLLEFCQDHENMRCLHYSACGNFTKTHNFNNYKFLRCSGGTFFLNPQNIQKCCSYAEVNSSECKWDSLIDHYDLFDDGKRKLKLNFLNRNFPSDAVRFVSIRHPFNQFVSWRNHQCKNKKWFRTKAWFCLEKNLTKVIENYDSKTKEPGKYNNLHNFQAKFLGFDGSKKSLENKVFPFLRKADLILISDRLREGWCVLRQKLNWPERYLRLSDAHNSPDYNLTAYEKRILKKIQWADLRVYQKANELFDFNAENFQDSCAPDLLET